MVVATTPDGGNDTGWLVVGPKLLQRQQEVDKHDGPRARPLVASGGGVWRKWRGTVVAVAWGDIAISVGRERVGGGEWSVLLSGQRRKRGECGGARTLSVSPKILPNLG
jgi:hypothetical protein